jgi:hypothetical protein
LKELETLRIWIDRLYGLAWFTLYWRNDQYPCWHYWNAWTECAARNDCEDPGNTNCAYPTAIYKQQYRAMMAMPKPPNYCDSESDRPAHMGYSFQFRLVIKGYCRVRGIFAYALPREEPPFGQMRCIGSDPCGTCPPGADGEAGADGARGAGMVTNLGVLDDPNGFITGNKGDAYKNTDSGLLWFKTTQGGNTGWA